MTWLSAEGFGGYFSRLPGYALGLPVAFFVIGVLRFPVNE